MRNVFGKFVASVLDWMIVLKIEDDYIQKQLEIQKSIKHQREIELQGIVDARLTRAQREYARATRIGERINADAEICYASYGYHEIIRDPINHQGYFCLSHSKVGHFGFRCQRCGWVNNFRNHHGHDPYCHEPGDPLVIGAYCDCDHCARWVGKDAPYVIEDPPEEWVISAFWNSGKLYPRKVGFH